MKSLQGQLTALVKDGQKLGALDEGVLTLVREIMPDATTLQQNIAGNKDAVVAGLRTGRGLFTRKLQQQGQVIQYHLGLPPDLSARTRAVFGLPQVTNESVIGQDRQRRLDELRHFEGAPKSSLMRGALGASWRATVNALREISPF